MNKVILGCLVSSLFLAGQPLTLAQNTVDLCRRVSEEEGLAVHLRPTPNSPTVGGVPYRSQVELVADGKEIRGPGGRTWVEIREPMSGFVSQGYPDGGSNFVSCGTALPARPTTVEPSSLCRRPDPRKTPKGLVIRARPTRFSPQRGGVAVGQRLYLVDGYEPIPDLEGEPRNWVEIVAPIPGFVSGDGLMPCK